MQEVYLVVGVKESEGNLKLTKLEAHEGDIQASEAAERAENPEYDYVAVLHAYSTAPATAEPKGDAA